MIETNHNLAISLLIRSEYAHLEIALERGDINLNYLYPVKAEGKKETLLIRFCDDYDKMEWLVINGADVNLKMPITGITVLQQMMHEFSKNEDGYLLLLKNGADINEICQDEEGRGLLLAAVDERHINLVKYLLKQGMNVDTVNKQGHTPLGWAIDDLENTIRQSYDDDGNQIYDDHEDVIADLLEIIYILHTAGANFNYVNKARGNKPIFEPGYSPRVKKMVYDYKDIGKQLGLFAMLSVSELPRMRNNPFSKVFTNNGPFRKEMSEY